MWWHIRKKRKREPMRGLRIYTATRLLILHDLKQRLSRSKHYEISVIKPNEKIKSIWSDAGLPWEEAVKMNKAIHGFSRLLMRKVRMSEEEVSLLGNALSPGIRRKMGERGKIQLAMKQRL
jgi:hypothetical protein